MIYSHGMGNQSSQIKHNMIDMDPKASSQVEQISLLMEHMGSFCRPTTMHLCHVSLGSKKKLLSILT